MRYHLTDQDRRRDHFSYLTRVIVHAVIVVGAFAFANGYFHPEYRVLGNILASLIAVGGYLPWRNYIRYLRYVDKQAYVEVDNKMLWLSNARLGKVAFPLHDVHSFVHKMRPTEVIELRTVSGDELDLRDYERMDELVENLRRTPAGLKYQIQS